jgi:predicted RNA-binding protein
MCEFKIINQINGSQIAEDILILTYTENNELVLKDVLGMGVKLDSALILDVNTMNQKCYIIEHPLIKEFISLIKNVKNKKIDLVQIENFQKSLENLKKKNI